MCGDHAWVAEVRVHDFLDPVLGKVVPYGIYDIANNEGWVNVGDNADTAEFAVNSIRTWWEQMGRARFPGADRLLITADGGGSNDYRLRAWKTHLAALASETGLRITVTYAYDFLLPQVDGWRSAGVFGPPVEVSADASRQDRLLALTGRRP